MICGFEGPGVDVNAHASDALIINTHLIPKQT